MTTKSRPIDVPEFEHEGEVKMQERNTGMDSSLDGPKQEGEDLLKACREPSELWFPCKESVKEVTLEGNRREI